MCNEVELIVCTFAYSSLNERKCGVRIVLLSRNADIMRFLYRGSAGRGLEKLSRGWKRFLASGWTLEMAYAPHINFSNPPTVSL